MESASDTQPLQNYPCKEIQLHQTVYKTVYKTLRFLAESWLIQ